MPAEIRSVLPNGAACSVTHNVGNDARIQWHQLHCVAVSAWLPGYLQTAYNLDLKSTG